MRSFCAILYYTNLIIHNGMGSLKIKKKKKIFYWQPTKPTQQSPSWESNISSATQQTPRTSGNLIAPYSIHVFLPTSPPPAILLTFGLLFPDHTTKYGSTVINAPHFCILFLMHQPFNGYVPMTCWNFARSVFYTIKLLITLFSQIKLHKCNHTNQHSGN